MGLARTAMSTLTPEKVFIVGLAGASGSGKSTVAKRVAARLKGHAISMEIYSVEMNHLPLEERAKLNYDEPYAHRPDADSQSTTRFLKPKPGVWNTSSGSLS